MPNDESCRTCGAALVLEQVDLRGRFQRYSVALLDFPLLRCPQGHETREVRDRFMVDLGQAVRFEHDLFAKREGLVRRRDACRRCGTELNPYAAASQRVDLALDHGGAPPYRVEITAPLVRCSKCAAPQIADREEHYVGIDSAIREAMAAAGARYQIP